MTTNSTNLNAFALAARQARTPEPLDILGEKVLVKLANADTNGAAAIFHLTVPPMSGPPVHRHSREDEWFYVWMARLLRRSTGSEPFCRRAVPVSRRVAPRMHFRTSAMRQP